MGEMPQRLDTIETSPDPVFGVIPLNEQLAYQGPVNESRNPQELWGKRDKRDNITHNFNSYRIPVASSFKVDLFKKNGGRSRGHSSVRTIEVWLPSRCRGRV
jgi:hypothetical protein